MRDALRLWKAQRELSARDAEVLRERWDEGKASGLAGNADMRALIADEKSRKAQRP